MRRLAASALRLAFVAVAAAAALQAAAEKRPYERYQSIVDRQPFGALPSGFDPMRNPDEVQKSSGKEEVELSKEQEDLLKNVQFSVINIEEDGSVMVGFTDKTDAKMPQHYYVAVGETRDGWFVKEADPIKETMTVVKDGIEIPLELGANSGPVAGAKGAAKGKGAPPSSGRPSLLRRGGAAESGGIASFRGRRAAREAREAEEREAAERAKAEAEAREAEEKAAREAEKAEREAERAEQREQLMTIREELRRAREEKAARKAEEAAVEEQEGGVADE